MAESKFPMTFDKCPGCGCEDTVTHLAWAEEAEKGRVKKDTPTAAQRLQIALIDPRKSPLLIGGETGILLMEIVYCAECGMGRCKKAQVAEGKLGQGPPPGMQPPVGPFSQS